jgi:hypothetical protein
MFQATLGPLWATHFTLRDSPFSFSRRSACSVIAPAVLIVVRLMFSPPWVWRPREPQHEKSKSVRRGLYSGPPDNLGCRAKACGLRPIRPPPRRYTQPEANDPAGLCLPAEDASYGGGLARTRDGVTSRQAGRAARGRRTRSEHGIGHPDRVTGWGVAGPVQRLEDRVSRHKATPANPETGGRRPMD